MKEKKIEKRKELLIRKEKKESLSKKKEKIGISDILNNRL